MVNSPIPLVWENTGSGFQPAYNDPAPGVFLWSRDASVADMDGDGDLDFVAQAQNAHLTGNNVVLLYENLGGFNFTHHTIYDQTSMSQGGVRAADFDFDGDMDLVTTTGTKWGGTDNQRLLLMENVGGLSFIPGFEGSQITGTQATIVDAIPWVGDAEGDGDLEVLTGEYYSGFLWGFNSPPPVVDPPEPPPTTLGISGWEMNRGGGYINLGQHIGNHGNPILYDWANIPGLEDANWGPAPNTETIGFSEPSQIPYGCLNVADFTYFQTFLSIPENTQLNEVTVEFYNADDGAQITVYNSMHPNGFSPPNAYIYLGGPAETTDISDYIAVGEVNRVVITQVDDCPTGNNLQYAAIVLNGTPILLNQAPTAEAGEDQTIDCATGDTDVTLNGSGSDADGDDLTYTWSNGTNTYTGASVTVSQGGGSETYTLTVSDGTAEATDDVTVTVNLDETAPVIGEIADVIASNDPGLCGANVNFDLSSAATDECELVSVIADPVSGSWFDLGSTDVTVTATDAAGNTSESSFVVTVEDNEAPSFVVSADAATMWPPNHKYRSFDLSDFGISVEDNCADLSTADVVITSVTSDEVEDARGGGDGKTKNDMVIGDGSVDLRAERQGGGNGRVYTIHLAVADGNGNSSEASYQVHVPHNRNSTAIDDGVAYTVDGSALAKFAGSFEDSEELAIIPDAYVLDQNYPNPFNPSTTIHYSLPEDAMVSLRVFDMKGGLVHKLVSGYQIAGNHEVSFQASDISSGTYIYVLEAGSFREVKRMAYLK